LRRISHDSSNFNQGNDLASWSSIKGSIAADPAFPFSGISAEYKSLAAGTGRVGYAYGNLLGLRQRRRSLGQHRLPQHD
jgi:hypothetical protein